MRAASICVPLSVLLSVGLLWLAGAANVRGDEPALNVSTLQPGAKLEMKWAGKWITVKFVERINDAMIRVERQDFPTPVPADVSWLRMPAGAAKPAAAGPDNPFATQEEKSAAKKRTWTDASGTFKVEATLVRIDGQSAVLRRDDGKEVVVPTARLSDADRKYLSEISTSAAPARGKAEKPDRPRIDITPTDITTATQVSVLPDAEWSYRPPSEESIERLSPTQLALRMNFHERPTRMLFLPEEKKVFVVSSETLFGNGNMYRVQSCDLATRKVGSPGNFGVNVAPLAIAPDGSLVVAQVEEFGHGGQSELQVYAREGDRVALVAAWLPYRHHTSTQGRIRPGGEATDPNRPNLSHHADVTWVEFLDPTHVITQSYAGELAVWSLPKIEPVYYLPADSTRGTFFLRPALSADRRHFAVPSQDGVALLQASDGKVVGVLPAEMAAFHINHMAWSDDGTRLALFQPGRVRVWDLTTQKLIRDFPVDTGQLVQNCGWVDNDHLVLNGQMVFDVARRIPLSMIDRQYPADSTIRGGIIWRLNTRAAGQAGVVGTKALPANFVDPAGGMTAEELLVIRPGTEVAIELPPAATPDGSDPHAAVLAQLERNGVKVVPLSNVRLVGTLNTGKTQSVEYTTFTRDQKSTHSVAEQVLNLSYLVDGEVVWNHEARMGAPPIVHLEKGESIGAALARIRKLDGSDFGRVWIPAYVARIPTMGEEVGTPR